MLSRVAENIYWLSRYLERASNTARLVESTGDLLYDLPASESWIWEELVRALGMAKTFSGPMTEHNVIKNLLVGGSNPSSVVSSISAARANAKSIREVITIQMWETINNLHLEAKELRDKQMSRIQFGDFTDQVRKSYQHYLGTLSETLSRNHAYDFCLLGIYLERADMVSRILETKISGIYSGEESGAYEASFWRSTLDSLGGLHMFLMTKQDVVRRDPVLEFVLDDPIFPRSLRYCLQSLERSFRRLPQGASIAKEVSAIRREVRSYSPKKRTDEQMMKKIDQFQGEMAGIHELIQEKYFDYA